MRMTRTLGFLLGILGAAGSGWSESKEGLPNMEFQMRDPATRDHV